jgi:hypothetical protein
MLNKRYGFILVETKDKLPDDVGIDDKQSCDTPAAHNSSKKKGINEDEALLSTLQQSMADLSQARAVQNKQLLEIMQGSKKEDNHHQLFDQGQLVRDIKLTTDSIEEHRQYINGCESNKRAILAATGSSGDKRKLLEPVVNDIKRRKKLVDALNITLEQQTNQLLKMNGGKEEESDGDDLDDISFHTTQAEI